MGTITKHPVATVLAAAEINRAVFLGGVGDRGEGGAFVGPIAEGLGFAFATGAPVVGPASFDSDGNGGGLGDFRSVHWWVFDGVGAEGFLSGERAVEAGKQQGFSPGDGAFPDHEAGHPGVHPAFPGPVVPAGSHPGKRLCGVFANCDIGGFGVRMACRRFPEGCLLPFSGGFGRRVELN